LLGRLAPFAPAAIVVAIWILLIGDHGGYFVRDSYPAAMVLVSLLAVVAIAGPRALPDGLLARIALLCFAGWVAWTFLSLLWTESPGAGWKAADGLLIVLASAWIVSLAPWRAGSASVLLAVWSIGVAAYCLASLLGALSTDDLGSYFVVYRYADPLGYPNGVSALALLGAWPALMMSLRRDWPLVAEAFFLALAAFLVEFALLPQSRGSVLGSAVAVVLLLAISRDRSRLVVRIGVIAVAVAVSVSPIYDVYTHTIELKPVSHAFDRAVLAIALTTGAVFLVGLALAALERTIPHTNRGRIAARRAIAGAAVALVVAGVGVAVVNAGQISHFTSERWNTFKSSKETPATNGPRLAADYSDQRYDYWRVAVDLFQEAPVAGVGAGSFEREYTARRKETKHARYTHDIWLRVLAEGGIAGALLFLGWLASMGIAIATSVRGRDRAERNVLAAGAAAAAYFLVHASLDWLDQFPVLFGPAVALALVGLATAARPAARLAEPSTAAAPAPWRRRALAVAGALVAVAAIASLAFPYLSERYADRGSRRWVSQPRQAYEDLDKAADLNPLSIEPLALKASIAMRRGDKAVARAALRESLHREDNWFAHFELALLDAQAGNFRRAGRQISRALELNDADPLVTEAQNRIRDRKPVDPAHFNREAIDSTLYKGVRLT
jgi:tetratricopeptide (TPR) repeat protein